MSHQVCHDVGQWVSSRAACSAHIALKRRRVKPSARFVLSALEILLAAGMKRLTPFPSAARGRVGCGPTLLLRSSVRGDRLLFSASRVTKALAACSWKVSLPGDGRINLA